MFAAETDFEPSELESLDDYGAALRHKYQKPALKFIRRPQPSLRKPHQPKKRRPEDLLFPATSPDQITSALQTRLSIEGWGDHNLHVKSNIYEQGISTFRGFIESVTPQDRVTRSALRELDLLTYALEQLFLGRIGLELKKDQLNKQLFTGWLGDDTQALRILINQNMEDVEELDGRTTFSSCQIIIPLVDILAQSRQKRRSDISRIRCGLRPHLERDFTAIPTLSIDSGIHRHSNGPWERLGALAQMAALNNQATVMPTPHSYTFHYDDCRSVESRDHVGFKRFNSALNQAFRQMAM